MKEFAYKVLDRITGGKGIRRQFSGVSLRLPTRYFRYFKPDYEWENIDFINKNVSTGMTVIDIGAHIGLFSVVLSKKAGDAGKVFAFEPTPATFNILTKTIQINNAAGIITPVKKAVADRTGKATFFISNSLASVSNSLADIERGPEKTVKVDVDLTSVDEFVQEHDLGQVDLIKIDAEGAELSVLKGASETIEKFHPKMILGVHPASVKEMSHSLEEIWDFIALRNYKVIHHTNLMDKVSFIRQAGLFDVFLVHEQ